MPTANHPQRLFLLNIHDEMCQVGNIILHFQLITHSWTNKKLLKTYSIKLISTYLSFSINDFVFEYLYYTVPVAPSIYVNVKGLNPHHG